MKRTILILLALIVTAAAVIAQPTPALADEPTQSTPAAQPAPPAPGMAPQWQRIPAGSGWRVAQGPGGPPPGGEMRKRERGPEMGGGMRGMGMPGGKWWKDSQVVQQIGLSDQQSQQIEKTFQDHRMQLIDLHANLEKAETQMEPLMQADQPNEAQVTAQIDKIAQARAALEKSNAQMLFAIRRIVTPDQWKKLQNMQHERPFGRGEGRGMGDGMGGPGGPFVRQQRTPRAQPGQVPPPAQPPQEPE